MTSANVTNTNVVPVETTLHPYNDDYNEDKGYLRELFRPGRAVQARELNQMQTMSQVQVERLGRHIFKNGSIVQGGVIQYSRATTINLQSQYGSSDVNVSDLVDKKIQYPSGETPVYYVQAYEGNTILVQNIIGGRFANGSTIVAVANGVTNVYANIATTDVYSTGFTAYLPDSIFFLNGFFVKVPSQTIFVSKHEPYVNCRIGLEFTSDIVTHNDDSSLLDPALESSNYQAPGADRFKITGTLAVRTLDSEDDSSFVELLRLKNGERDQFTKIPIYSEIEETFARRTYDESGNYTVKPFNLQLKASDNSSNIVTRLDPGKAYIFGYEFETIAPYNLEIPRPLDTSNVIGYDISTSYGNYVITKDMKGFFDISTMPTVDIHNVTYENINNANTDTYNATKIGTARLRNVLYEDSTDSSNGATHLFRSYIFDTQYTSLTGNASGGTVSTIIMNRPYIAAAANAYTGMYIRITAGAANGDIRRISSYNSVSKTATVDSNFSQAPATNTRFSIEGSFKDAESLVIATVGGTFTANTNISEESKTYGWANGDALLSETSYNSLLFPLPHSYVKANTGLNNYQYRKPFLNRTFTAGSGTITAGTGEALVGSGSLSNSIKLANYMVVVRDKQGSSNVANGDVLSFGDSSRTISIAGSTATLNANLPGDTFTADIIADVMINSGAVSSPKTKTLVSSNTTHMSSITANATLIGSSTTAVYLNDGQVWITNPNKVPNQEDSLYVSDIKTLRKVYDLNGATLTAGASLASYSDVTSKYTLDTGQYDNYYDHGAIKLKSGVSSPRGPLVVCFDYYTHGSGSSDGKGFFSIDSYPDVTTPSGYADVPNYTTETGQSISLRDVIDFRPVRENASNTSPNYTLNGVRIPTPNEEFTLNFDYYLPRRDLIVLSKDRNFKHIKGISSENPAYPKQPDDTMTLYKLDLPPYVVNFANVNVNFVENKRYTMRDIGKIDERLSHVEYYTSLNLLEKAASDLVITDNFGLERSKYGIIVDKFIGHQIGDVSNPDYKCAIDLEKGELRAPIEQNEHNLLKTTGSNYSQNGSIITVAYTSTPLIVQDKASKPVNLQPYAIANYTGIVNLTPDTDYWIDTIVFPDVVTNPIGTRDNWLARGNTSGAFISGTNQNPFSTEFNSWVSRWFGESETTIDLASRLRLTLGSQSGGSTGNLSPTIRTSVDPTRITTTVNESVLDISVIPFIRPREILFKVSGMRPKTNVWSNFDSVNVDPYIERANKLVLNGKVNFNDTPYVNEAISSGSNSATLVLNSKDNENDGNTVLYLANVKGFFAAGATITGNISGNSATVKSYDHYSGNASSALGNTSNIVLQVGASATNSYYVGNVIYLTAGPGAGSYANIVSYNGSSRIVSVDTPFSSAPLTNTRYSIGRTKTNIRGEFAGAYQLPQGRFRVGERSLDFGNDPIFKIGYLSSSASATYLASGLIQQKTRDIVTTAPPVTITVPPIVVPPEVPEWPAEVAVFQCSFTVGVDETGTPLGCWHEPDPIAETFIIDPGLREGIFLSSVDLFFRKKDDNLPVTIEIRPVVNGYPSATDIVPMSKVTLYPDKVNISETPDASDASTYTRFEFANPIYLLPGIEYALIVVSTSLEYEAWVAELGQKHVGSDRIISTQPYIGSFFRSQNKRTWTPYQFEDLMFRINRCVFSTSEATVFFKNEIPSSNKAVDWMYLSANEMKPSLTRIKYEMKSKNYADLSNDSSYTEINANKNYRHNARKIMMTSGESSNVKVTLSTVDDKVSPVLDPSRFFILGIKNDINDGGISNTLITMTNYGDNYTNASNIIVTISGGTTGEVSNAYVGSVSGGNITSIIVDTEGSYYSGRANVTISSGGGSNATARLASELDPSGGPSIARYITRKVTLNDGFDAGDLRVYITAYKPIGSELNIYCKVLSSDDPDTFESKDYTLMAQAGPTRYSSSENDFIEFEYRPSLTSNTIAYSSNTATYNSFKTFSIKIVMFSESTINIPIIKDLRAIALPGTD